MKTMIDQKIISTGCCEPFNPELWDNKETLWQDKLFVKDSIVNFFHIPINIGAKIAKNARLIEKVSANAEHQLMLFDEKSLFGSDIYIDVTKNVLGAQMAKLSGTFLTKVFEGPYQNMGKWIQEMKQYVKSKDKEVKKFYFFYTACPKCAKAYGKNYVVIFAQIK